MVPRYERFMDRVKRSPKYQIVIPKGVPGGTGSTARARGGGVAPPRPYRANIHGTSQGDARPFTHPRLRRSSASLTGSFEGPQRNAVDSSSWIKYFADGPNAEFFEAAILEAGSLVVPSISIST